MRLPLRVLTLVATVLTVAALAVSHARGGARSSAAVLRPASLLGRLCEANGRVILEVEGVEEGDGLPEPGWPDAPVLVTLVESEALEALESLAREEFQRLPGLLSAFQDTGEYVDPLDGPQLGTRGLERPPLAFPPPRGTRSLWRVEGILTSYHGQAFLLPTACERVEGEVPEGTWEEDPAWAGNPAWGRNPVSDDEPAWAGEPSVPGDDTIFESPTRSEPERGREVAREFDHDPDLDRRPGPGRLAPPRLPPPERVIRKSKRMLRLEARKPAPTPSTGSDWPPAVPGDGPEREF